MPWSRRGGSVAIASHMSGRGRPMPRAGVRLPRMHPYISIFRKPYSRGDSLRFFLSVNLTIGTQNILSADAKVTLFIE